MTDRLCLRCDWAGEAGGSACPRCGAPLYHMGYSGETPQGEFTSPARRDADQEGVSRRSVRAPEAEEEVLPPVSATGGGRMGVIVLALSLAAASFGFALIRAGDPGPAEGRAGNAGAQPGMPSPGLFSPGEKTSSLPVAGQCVEAPRRPELTPADSVPAAAADYRFQGSLGSAVGDAPDLAEIGKGATAFTDEGMIGRTVLSFTRRSGLSLTPTTGVISSTEYTIEILFRFDRLRGYRKIVDFKDGSDDNGLYVVDGCLNFYPRPLGPSTPIEADSYVQVVLTRGPTDTVLGYVDGVRQFVFSDGVGVGEIGPADTLRFFVDDSRTRREYSSGAVSQIRLYDRALTANEIAAIACAEIRVPLSNHACPAL